jgi:hypothetical protein
LLLAAVWFLVGTLWAAPTNISPGKSQGVSLFFRRHWHGGASQLTLSTTTINFGGLPLNTVATQSLTLTSSGTAAVTVNSATLSGAGFSITGTTFPVTLNPGQTATLQVSFDPTVAGAASGTITISSTASGGSTSTVALSGTGTAPQLTLSASSVSFGNDPVGTTVSQSVTLTSSGTAAVKVNSATLSGTGFSMTGTTFPVTLNPGQTATLQVSFDPTAAGAANGTITISSNSASGSTATVSLTGTGTTPQLTLSANTVSFGDDPVGTTVSQSETLTSSGTAPVTISGATITGTGFSFTGATFPVTLNPTIALAIQVQFDPTATGAASGALTFASNSTTGSTSVVNLSGTGTATQHQVSLSWAAPASSPDPVSGYNIYRATGSSSSFQRLNPSSNTPTSYVDLTIVASTTYTYYVASVDSQGIESVPSNEVTVTVP